MSIRVLLVNPPIRLRSKPDTYPYGLALIAAVLQKAGIEVEVLDLNAMRPDQGEVRAWPAGGTTSSRWAA